MLKMADDWDMPLGADARSFSSKECKYDTWDDDYESIHNTASSISNTVKSIPNASNTFHNTIDDEYDGWIPAKTKSSRAKESAKNSKKDGKQQFNEGKLDNSKHSQRKNKAKYNSQTDNHDSWNTNETKNHSSRNWNFADNSGCAQASAPVVNVWEERMKRSEEIKSIEPVNETEEEAMIRHAIELSKLEAQKNEENQKRLAKEYELQMQLLASNPEMEADISEAFADDIPSTKPSTFNDDAASYKASNGFKNEKKVEVPKNSVYDRNGKKSMDYGGAKPKFGRIIDSFGGWGIKDVPKTCNESNDCWGEPNGNNYSSKTKSNDCWDEPTEKNDSSESCVRAKPRKMQPGTVWGDNDVPKTPSEPNDCWSDPDENSYDAKTESNNCLGEANENNYGAKTESNDCWEEPDKKNYDYKSTERNNSSEYHIRSKPQKEQSTSDWGIKKDIPKTHSESNDCWGGPDENNYDAKTESNDCWGEPDRDNYGSGTTKEVEASHSWYEITKGTSPEYSNVNHSMSKDSDVHNSKKALEFEEFVEELKRNSIKAPIEEKKSENSKIWEDKNSVQLSNNKWEISDNLIGSNDASNHENSYDFFSSGSFDALTISSNSMSDRHDAQPSCSFPETASTSNLSTCNPNEFLLQSNPSNIANQNLSSNDSSNSSRYGDFQTNEINTEKDNLYNPFISKMPSIPKQTLLEENGGFQSSDQTFSHPTNNFIPAEENPSAVYNNLPLNQTPSPVMMPNMPLGNPVMPVPMPFSPTFVSPCTNPILLQQMLMLNNPFFVKQLQVLDMYYRSLGMPPCSGIPLAPVQMPLANNSPQDPSFLVSQNQVPVEHEQSIPHNMIFSSEKEVLERKGVVPNPPGLNDFMQTEKQIDTLQQAEINLFLDKYCDNDFENDVPPIPPPKPAVPKCSDPSNLISESSALGVASGDPFRIENQKNVGVMHTINKSYDNVVPLKVNQNALRKDHVGWGVLDSSAQQETRHDGWGDLDGSNARQQQKWNEELDGWGSKSTTKLVRKPSNMEAKTVNRQPSSQPIVGRYKRQK